MRHEKIYRVNDNRSVVSVSDGQDYYIDKVSEKIGVMEVVRGTVFHPVEKGPDHMLVQQQNGWSAPAAAYYGVSREMAKRGVSVATYDNYKVVRPEDISDPLIGAEQGGLRMIRLFEDVAGDDELALLGHSTGGFTAARMAEKTNRASYVVAEAPVGVEFKQMYWNYMGNAPGIVGELGGYSAQLFQNRDGMEIASEFMRLNSTDPSRLGRQVLYLSMGPDLKPYLDEAHAKGMQNGLILFEEDSFLIYRRQLEALRGRESMFDEVLSVPGAKHLYPNQEWEAAAETRLEMLNLLRAKKFGQTAVNSL